jgi:DNA-binding HxlR family transcriptional regulator
MVGKNMCPLDTTMSYIGNKWTVQVIRDLLIGKKRFSEILDNNSELSAKVLSNRLKDLVNKGIILKKVVSSESVLIEYYLTERGKKLNNILLELVKFTVDEFPEQADCSSDKFEMMMNVLEKNKSN